jgi:hypothetical protein
MATTKKAAARKSPRPAPSGETAHAEENICFTIMPYGEWHDHYYENIYAPAIAAADLTPKRADELSLPGAITHGIWILANQASVILADLTGKNPNVFYELGLGHALAKPAILVTDRNGEEVPFDLRSLRVIYYDKNDPYWGDKLKADIRTAIKEVLASPEDAALPTFLINDQINSLRQELRRVSRQRRPPSAGSRRKETAAPNKGKDGQIPGPGMSHREAVEFARRYLEKREPSVFIESMLEYNRFDKGEVQRILEEARLPVNPPPPPAAGKGADGAKPHGGG